MILAEEFKRCDRCNQGWFEKKEIVLLYNDIPYNGKPEAYKSEIQFHCTGCGFIQHSYTSQS